MEYTRTRHIANPFVCGLATKFLKKLRSCPNYGVHITHICFRIGKAYYPPPARLQKDVIFHKITTLLRAISEARCKGCKRCGRGRRWMQGAGARVQGADASDAGVAGNARCKGYWRCKHCLHSNNKAARLFRALQHIKQHSEWKNE